MSPVRVGVVGYGFAGRDFHCYLVKLAEGLRLAAVATRDPERRARAESEQGVATFESLDQMLDSDAVDLVVLATPHDTHRDLAVRTLQAGRHVVVDKVMALTARECDDMILAARQEDLMLSVFHNRRWDGDFLTVKHALDSGLLGDPLMVEIGIYGHGTPGGWRGRRAQMGGILYDWGAHLVDQALQLFPEPIAHVYGVSQFRNPGTDIESFARCELLFQSGAICAVEVSNRARLGKHHWHVYGSKGTLTKDGVDPQEAVMRQRRIQDSREDPAQRAHVLTEVQGQMMDMVIDTISGSWTSYYQNIADVLTKGAPLAVQPEGVRKAVSVLEAQRLSAETGRAIPGDKLP
jgi:scyllo-inositol 2-dehydrogenase (NADP+)